MKKSLPTDLSADDSTTFENLLREYYLKGRISKTVIAKYIFKFVFILRSALLRFTNSKIVSDN